MQGFPRHESYKDSGVEWLGEIPSQLGYLAILRPISIGHEKNGSNTVDEMLSVSRYHGVD